MAHLRPYLFGENKKERTSGLGMGMQNTCAKIQGLSLKNGVDIYLECFAYKWMRYVFPSDYLVLVPGPVFSLDSA